MRRRRRAFSAGRWPDEHQRLLLQAATSGDERALRAWDRWRMLVTPQQVNGADTALLATAYRPLRRRGADDPMLTLAGGAYRRNWYINQLTLRRAASIVADLQAAGIEALVLGGIPLSLLYYRDLGARPLEDIDLLVGPGRLDDAVRALHRSGWGVLAAQSPSDGPLRYAARVVDPDGDEIDLHAFALLQSADDSGLWESRVGVELMGTAAFTLSAADQLVHVCVERLGWNETANLRWAADAMAILTSAGADLDWQLVVERSRGWRVTVAVSRALSWLRESLAAPVPAWVPTQLRAGPRLPFERTVHAVSMRPPTPLTNAVMSFDRYRRFAKLAPAERRPESFAAYLQSAWGLQSSAQLLVHGGRKLVGRSR